jgi:bifunctional UDP-N-acetylglucosamine pyrophosphorylase/glucosamine-1-phosphate N-acetyltransferase
MKALILAAGEGTRMRPLTANVPKPLLPVAGKPFLQHIIEILEDLKIRDIDLLIGWKDLKIKEYFGDGKKFNVKINYLQQEKRLGTAHAVGMAKETISEPFICLNGDVVITAEIISKVLADFKKNKNVTLTGAEVDNPSEYGILETKDGKLVKIHEKPTHPPTNIANAGIYLFTPEIFKHIEKTELSSRGEYEITDSINMLSLDTDVSCVITKEDWIDVGRPWDLLHVNTTLMKNIEEKTEGEIEKHADIKGTIQVGKGSIIKNGSYIIGPVIIGDNCTIGPNCMIRPSTVIGNSCKIGNSVEVKNSIIMDSTNVPHNSYVGDSIIGQRCNLGAGTKVANLRLDEKNIKVILRGRLTDTGLRKLGVIMGDDVKTGINSSIDSGTIIGENSFIGPNALASGNIAPNSWIH